MSDRGPHSIQTALIVEDDPMQSVVVETLLQDYGIPSVLTAADAETAATLARQHRIDLLICDLSLPGRDGVSLIREIGQQPHRPAVVVLSGVDGSVLNAVGNIATNLKINFLGAVAKPLRLETLDALLCKTQDRAEVPAAASDQEEIPDALLLLGIRQGWYLPYYEARISSVTGKVEGVEVLARMCLPGGTIVEPKAFIGPLETAGKIDELTWHIAGRAFEFASRLRRLGVSQTLSLNLSPLMLDDEVLPDRLSALVRQWGLAPETVLLEVTEAAAIDDTQVSRLERLVNLRLRGFGLSIDDFGTGFSSLAQLSKAPFTEMKIDRLFACSAITDAKARAVVESSIDLARRLGIRICAEGVENESVFELIHSLGVDTMQGYLFHRPMPAEDFLRWAQDWNAGVTIDSLKQRAARIGR